MKIPEGVVIGRGRVLGGVRTSALVVGVVGHEVAAVDVGREDERVLDDHLHHRLGLRLDLKRFDKSDLKNNNLSISILWFVI